MRKYTAQIYIGFLSFLISLVVIIISFKVDFSIMWRVIWILILLFSIFFWWTAVKKKREARPKSEKRKFKRLWTYLAPIILLIVRIPHLIGLKQDGESFYLLSGLLIVGIGIALGDYIDYKLSITPTKKVKRRYIFIIPLLQIIGGIILYYTLSIFSLSGFLVGLIYSLLIGYFFDEILTRN